MRPMTLQQIGDATGDAAYLADRDMALDHDHCFLCGVELIAGNRTEEHVFPRWMQREYDLWTQRLTLLNFRARRSGDRGGRARRDDVGDLPRAIPR
jgi:hypothetical protein